MMDDERHFGPLRFIPGDNNGKYPYCHSIFIEGGGILIDPASNRGRMTELKNKKIVREVWLSHWHEDHFMHLDLFEDIPLRTSKQDAVPLSDIEMMVDSYGMDNRFRDDWKKSFRDVFHFRPRKPVNFFQDGEIIQVGDVNVEVILTPGHTPGHIALFFHEPEVLFMGDYDLSSFGPWYGDAFSSIDDTIKSVRRLQSFPARIWLTSHEQGIFEKNPSELWDKYLEVIRVRENKLLELLKTPRTMDEIVGACIVYRKPREPKMFFEFGERATMGKHLEHLMGRGIVKLEGGRYFIS